MGFQMPIDLLQYDSLSNITYENGKIKMDEKLGGRDIRLFSDNQWVLDFDVLI